MEVSVLNFFKLSGKLFFNYSILKMNNTFGQRENETNKKVANQFESFYNVEKYDSIFEMLSIEMQNVLPIEKTKYFFLNLKSNAGQIKKRIFEKYVNGTYASYKTVFEKALLRVDISINSNEKINGLFVKSYTDNSLPVMKRNITKLKLPFKGEWTVLWGGDSKELNYHIENIAQKNAFDILITDSTGSSHKNNGENNEDYYAFDQPIFAPCDGEIVLAVDGVKDNETGILNPIYLSGNSVILKTNNNEFLVFAHFKNHSVDVKEGQKIKEGQKLGLCGNSGNSSEPHLHFHIQNIEDMNIATGVKCYFDKIILNGQLKTDYSPIKCDKIKNE